MNIKPVQETVIMKNDMPEKYIGREVMYDSFGLGYAFTFDQAIKDNLLFQSQPYLKILEYETNKQLFEFRTFSFYLCNSRIENDDFYKVIHSFVLSAVSEFDRILKANKSTLTLFKSYSPIPTVEQIKTPVRQAYMMLNFDKRTSNN